MNLPGTSRQPSIPARGSRPRGRGGGRPSSRHPDSGLRAVAPGVPSQLPRPCSAGLAGVRMLEQLGSNITLTPVRRDRPGQNQAQMPVNESQAERQEIVFPASNVQPGNVVSSEDMNFTEVYQMNSSSSELSFLCSTERSYSYGTDK